MFSARVQPRQQAGQPRGGLSPAHAVGEVGGIIGPQDQHIKAGQDGVDIVVIEHRIGQTVQVIERPQRLCQFLVQTIANLLRGGVGGNENCSPVAPGQRGPVHLRGAPDLGEIGPAADAWHHETGSARHIALQFGLTDPLNRDAGLGCAGQKYVDPCLGSQPVDQQPQIGDQRGRNITADAHRNRPLEPGHFGNRTATFHAEGEVEEILRNLAIGPGGAGDRGPGKAAHRRQAVTERHCTAGRRVALHRCTGGQDRQGQHGQTPHVVPPNIPGFAATTTHALL